MKHLINLKFAGFMAILLLAAGAPASAKDGEVGCVDTTFKLIGANHKVCINSFRDPNVPGVVCHLSQAKTGGISGAIGLAEDKSEFSLSCIQTGPIALPLNIPPQQTVFNERTSIFFKSTRVTRFYDKDNNALVYLAISDKLIEGSPKNAISNVAISPWAQQ